MLRFAGAATMDLAKARFLQGNSIKNVKDNLYYCKNETFPPLKSNSEPSIVLIELSVIDSVGSIPNVVPVKKKEIV